MTWQAHFRRLQAPHMEVALEKPTCSSTFVEFKAFSRAKPSLRHRRRVLRGSVQVEMRGATVTEDCRTLLNEDISLSSNVSADQVRVLEDAARLPAANRPATLWDVSSSETNSAPSRFAQEKSGPAVEQGVFSFQLGRSAQALILLNVGAALFGSNQVVIKLAEADLTPELLNTLRFGLAALCFAPAIVKGLQKRELWKPAAELGFWLFGGYTAQALGLMQTTAARGAFTGTFTVLVVPVLVGLSGRSVSMKTWLAAAVALAGVGLLTNDSAAPNMGDALCVLSAILFGVHKWRTESVTAKHKDDTTELIGLQLGVLALTSGLSSLPLLGNLLANSPGDVLQGLVDLPWLPLAYMGLATTAFTLWIEMHALKDVSAPLAALIYTAEPLWGGLFAYLVLAERWGPMGWVGAALIIGASLASQISGSASEPSAQSTESPEPEECLAPENEEWLPQGAIPATCAAALAHPHKMRTSPEGKPLGMAGHNASSNLSHRPAGRRSSVDNEH
eukprot:jgi/Botrbrau1/7405/Bobra.0112s0006.1